MSYDYSVLAAHVRIAIEADPHVRLQSICEEWQVDRHTINRALLATLGVRFSELKEQVRRHRLERALTDGETKSIKRAAVEAGYSSSSALARRTRATLGMTPTAVRRRGRS